MIKDLLTFYKKEIEIFKELDRSNHKHFLLLSPDITLLNKLVEYFKKITRKKFYLLSSNKNLSLIYKFLEDQEIIFYTNNASLIDNFERRLRSRFNHRIICFTYFHEKPYYSIENEKIQKKYQLDHLNIFTPLNKIDYFLLFIFQEIKIVDFPLTYRKYQYLTINLPLYHKIKKEVIFRHFTILSQSAFFTNKIFSWYFKEIEERAFSLFSTIERNELRKIKY